MPSISISRLYLSPSFRKSNVFFRVSCTFCSSIWGKGIGFLFRRSASYLRMKRCFDKPTQRKELSGSTRLSSSIFFLDRRLQIGSLSFTYFAIRFFLLRSGDSPVLLFAFRPSAEFFFKDLVLQNLLFRSAFKSSFELLFFGMGTSSEFGQRPYVCSFVVPLL